MVYFRGLTVMLFLFVILVTSSVEAHNEGFPALKWPSTYTFKTNKLTLTAALDEDVTYWRTSTRCRIDYNEGAVKYVFVKAGLRKELPFGVQYEVHPESTEEDNNQLKCIITKGTFHDSISLKEILPEESSFERVGTEILELGEVQKFHYRHEDPNSETRCTLWASYDNGTWIPVRYEEIEYNIWLGRLKSHIVWNYYDFQKEVNRSVFLMDKYICRENEEVDSNDEAVTKQLEFIDHNNNKHVDRVFGTFKRQHNRRYDDKKEHDMRRDLFKRRLRLIVENNRNNTGYKLTVNKFADRTPEEMKMHKGLIRKSKRDPATFPFPYKKRQLKQLSKKLPIEYDLRTVGLVTPVKNQEKCGSCWTFGTTSAVEGALARKNGGRLLRLSNQALIDCAWGYDNDGCGGGFDIGAYKWMMEHGLPTEEEYGTYKNADGFCNIKNMTKIFPIKGFVNVSPFDVEALKVAVVNHGPLSISVQASEAFQLYSGGVFYDTDCSPRELDHEVTLVGYGQKDGDEFWIVKNSWGPEWGVDGYIYMSVRNNNCGVMTEPTFVVV